jgi:hypothetical protein
MSDARARGVLAGLLVMAFAWRAVLVWRTPVPSEDGVNYLWMAEQFAAGDFVTPLSEVFPPLLGLLMAPAVGIPHGGALVIALLGALSIVPMARLSAALAQDRAHAAWFLAALLAAVAGLPARYCAEVYTEPVFHLVIACAALAGVRGRYGQCGVWSGAGFWLRSEAALLPLAFFVCAPRRAWRALVGLAASVLILAVWRACSGSGDVVVPKLAFNWSKSNLGGGNAVHDVGSDLLALPGAWLEAFGVVGVLAIAGAIAWRRDRAAVGQRAVPLLLALALAVAVIVAFAVRRRFLVAWWPLVLPFGVVALLRFSARWRIVTVAAAVALAAGTGLRTTDASRIAEREVGHFLRANLAPGTTVVTDFTRVRYFAGLRPLPPRAHSAAELVAAARAPSVRYLVLGTERATTPPVLAALPEFTRLPVSDRFAARGLAVFARSPQLPIRK